MPDEKLSMTNEITSPSPNLLTRFYQRIEEKTQDKSAPALLMIALGDSVTAGSGNEGEFLPDDVYHAHLKRLLENRYPLCIFNVINAGENGKSAGSGLAMLERDVLPHQPDLVLIGFALNDAAAGGLEGLNAYATALEILVKRTRENTRADIILLTPNMMLHYENNNIPARWKHVTERLLQVQNDGVLAEYAQRMREVGSQNGVAVADVYAAWEEMEKRGIDTTAMLANGLNHPNAAGHKLAAEVIFQAMEKFNDTAYVTRMRH